MYKDIHRIEDSIIPALLEGIIFSHIKHEPNVKESYEIAIGIVADTINQCYNGIYCDKRVKLLNRMNRIVNKLNRYLVKEKFDTRKAFLTISAWAAALIEAQALIVEPGSKIYKLLQDMGEVIQTGYTEIENFEKIDASAINHVESLHKLAQEEGYFL